MADIPMKIDDYRSQLDWIDDQRDRMIGLVEAWAHINSQSENLLGLVKMAEALKQAFAVLGGKIVETDLPPVPRINQLGQSVWGPVGRSISIVKPAQIPDPRCRVLLNIHMDTVYPAGGSFQRVERMDELTLRGPGVADAKGGLAVMLIALEALDRSPWSGQLSWEVLINPDEEIGSPSSVVQLREAATRNDLGLLFEPALDEAGTLASSRSGSGNFTIVVRGQAAHAGREFARGRNAIVAIAKMVTAIHALNEKIPGVTVNVGQIEGGGPVNVVPDLAILRLNVRITTPQQAQAVLNELDWIVAVAGRQEGIDVALTGGFHCPPKLLDQPLEQLLKCIASCGADLGQTITWRPTGGVCDGNKLAAMGLPTVDSLGVLGGAIHSSREYLLVESLTQRAKLVALLLMTLARGTRSWK